MLEYNTLFDTDWTAIRPLDAVAIALGIIAHPMPLMCSYVKLQTAHVMDFVLAAPHR